MQNQKYTIDNPPSLEEPNFVIEQNFLRHIKTETIPNLEEYLKKLNHYGWTCLLALNPRKEFIALLSDEMIPLMEWKYILSTILDYDCWDRAN